MHVISLMETEGDLDFLQNRGLYPLRRYTPFLGQVVPKGAENSKVGNNYPSISK